MEPQLIDEATDSMGIHVAFYSVQGKYGAIFYEVVTRRAFYSDKTKSRTRFGRRSEANNMFIGLVEGLGLYPRGKE